MTNFTKLKIELAKAMAKFSEYVTDKGTVYSEGDWVSTNTTLYVFNDNGELIPAENGDYTSPERTSTYKYKEIWTVENGVVTSIQSISTSSETTEEVTPAEETPATETTEPTEEVVAEQTEETPVTEPIAEEVKENEVDIKFNKVFEMMNTLVNEMSTIKVDVEALNTTMTNAKMGQQSVVIKDAAVNKSKELHPIWSVK